MYFPSVVKLISLTKPISKESPEELMVKTARVSSKKSDEELIANPEKLLRYCWEHEHYSIFEMADMTMEITTSLAIVPQFLRHKSFSFQQFSMRYASPTPETAKQEFRFQDTMNRQASGVPVGESLQLFFEKALRDIEEEQFKWYQRAIDHGISRETARPFLPLNTKTKFYMKGSIRSWMTYLRQRLDDGAQKEHMMIARQIHEVLSQEFPICGGLLLTL